MIIKQTFALQAKQFIISCCRQRLYLLRSNRSQLHSDNVFNIATGLQNEIQILYTDLQLANFLHRRSNEILLLMPGKNCKGIQKRLKEFNELIFLGNKILNSN